MKEKIYSGKDLFLTAVAGIVLGVLILSTIYGKTNNTVAPVIIGPKTELTLSEIKELPMPFGATWVSYDKDGNKADEGRIRFEDYSWKYNTDLILNYKESSGIEDGMIYTLCDCMDVTGRHCEVLFINNPKTLEWVAMSKSWDNGTNQLYTFYDKDGKTVYDKGFIVEEN